MNRDEALEVKEALKAILRGEPVEDATNSVLEARGDMGTVEVPGTRLSIRWAVSALGRLPMADVILDSKNPMGQIPLTVGTVKRPLDQARKSLDSLIHALQEVKAKLVV